MRSVPARAAGLPWVPFLLAAACGSERSSTHALHWSLAAIRPSRDLGVVVLTNAGAAAGSARDTAVPSLFGG
jgi:hypothetical protein